MTISFPTISFQNFSNIFKIHFQIIERTKLSRNKIHLDRLSFILHAVSRYGDNKWMEKKKREKEKKRINFLGRETSSKKPRVVHISGSCSSRSQWKRPSANVPP